MPDEISGSILQLALELEQADLLKTAAIGKGFTKQQKPNIRNDQIFWVDQLDHQQAFSIHRIFEELKNIVRANFYLPIKRYECHFAKYEKGSFYLRHQDTHSEKPGRLVSCVLYLNTCPEGEGGELILYDEELRPIKIRPERGKLVVFDSSLEHEVKTTQVDRWSVTGWLRSDLHPGLRLL